MLRFLRLPVLLLASATPLLAESFEMSFPLPSVSADSAKAPDTFEVTSSAPVILPFKLDLLNHVLLRPGDLEDCSLDWRIKKSTGNLQGASLALYRPLKNSPQGFEEQPAVQIPLSEGGALKITGLAPILREWAADDSHRHELQARILAPAGDKVSLVVVNGQPAGALRAEAAVLKAKIAANPSVQLFPTYVMPQPNVYGSIKDGHLYYGKQRLRMWGTNILTYPMNIEAAVHTAARLRRLGYNAVRLGGPGWMYSPESMRKGEFAKAAPGSGLDVYDRFVAECKKQGIFLYCTAFESGYFVKDQAKAVPESLLADDSFIAGGADWTEWKQAIEKAKKGPDRQLRFFYYLDERLQKVERKNASNYLNHVNPYTGKRYAEEEILVLFQLHNENGFINWIPDQGLSTWPDYFRDKMVARWNEWLKKTYRDDRALAAAWGKLNEGESISGGTVGFHPLYNERNQYPKARGNDLVRFLIDVVDSYNQGMRSFCRSHAPAGVGINSAGFIFDTIYRGCVPWLYANSLGDVSAISMYFWSMGSSLVTPPALYIMDSSTVKGIPTIVYETNAGRPNPYRSEYAYKIAALGAYQDWDAVFWHIFEINGKNPRTRDEQYLSGAMSLMAADHYWSAVHTETDPALQGSITMAGQFFLSGALKPAANPVTFNLGNDVVQSYQLFGGLDQKGAAFRTGNRIAFVGNKGQGVQVEGEADTAKVTEAVWSGNEILWDWPNGRLILDTPTAKAYIGRTENSYEFKDGVVLSGFNTPFVAFSMISPDGKPLTGPGATNKMVLEAVFDARNSGFSLMSENVPARAFSPREFVKSIKDRGVAPVISDQAGYALSFPTALNYRLADFDFALRMKSEKTSTDSNVVAVQDSYLSVLEIGGRGTARSAFVAPSQIKANAMASAGTAGTPRIGGELWNPLSPLSWSMDHADAHKVLRESPQPFTSISRQSESPDLIVLTESESILGHPANIEIRFDKGQMKRISATFTKSPNIQEAIAEYAKILGAPAEQKLVQVAHDTSLVRWSRKSAGAEVEVILTDTQGTMTIVYQLVSKS